MSAHILIIDSMGNPYTIKKSDIRRVEPQFKLSHPFRRRKDFKEESIINFGGTKNTPIRVNGTVGEFFSKHMAK